MLLVKRLSHTRKIISSCYFARLRKSSSGKGCSFAFCVTRMRTILDFADLSTIKIMIFEMMDGVYLLGNVFPIFWRRLWYRGRYIFFYNEFFPIFSRGENCDEILEILDVSQWRSGFEYLSTIKTVNDTGQVSFAYFSTSRALRNCDSISFACHHFTKVVFTRWYRDIMNGITGSVSKCEYRKGEIHAIWIALDRTRES